MANLRHTQFYRNVNIGTFYSAYHAFGTISDGFDAVKSDLHDGELILGRYDLLDKSDEPDGHGVVVAV